MVTTILIFQRSNIGYNYSSFPEEFYWVIIILFFQMSYVGYNYTYFPEDLFGLQNDRLGLSGLFRV
jgi:hypothetical protein